MEKLNLKTPLENMLSGYRLTTANILYQMPDYPDLLQRFVWQTYDLAPYFPEIKKFLTFWEKDIEGRLHSVELIFQDEIKPSDSSFAECELLLN